MRVGMIGLDTSHVVAFAEIFRNGRDDADLAEVEIVAGYPAGTELPLSRDRVEQFTSELADQGVEIVDSIAALLERVDAVMLTSVDGSVHLQQAQPIFAAGLPVFIDKPLAGSVADASEIQRLAQHHGVACFSSSCIRFSSNLRALIDSRQVGEIVGAATWGLCQTVANVPDLFFYGIHGIEGLFALMGRGCVRVQRTHLDDVELIVGVWQDGRVGTYRGIGSGKAEFGATVYGSEQIASVELGIPYRELCVEIARFFRSGVAPVDLAETIEIMQFMEAAEESKRQGGRAVELADLGYTDAIRGTG